MNNRVVCEDINRKIKRNEEVWHRRRRRGVGDE
jgi:hypothetical protein